MYVARSTALCLLATAAGLVLVGCDPGVTGTASCLTSEDCDDDQRCHAGLCRAVCASAEDCEGATRCVEAVCLPLGASCQEDRDCLAVERCVGGTCRPLCETEADCSAPEVCSAGVCVPAADAGPGDGSVPDVASADRSEVDAGGSDRATMDALAVDVAALDAAMPDAPRADRAGLDRGVVDRASSDASMPDTSATDTLGSDTLRSDSSSPDIPLPDTLLPDTLLPDTLLPDTLLPDTLLPDTLLPDTLTPDSFICPAGTTWSGSVCEETACADGIDNDGNGEADYDGDSGGLIVPKVHGDPNCRVRVNAISAPGTVSPRRITNVDCSYNVAGVRSARATFNGADCDLHSWSGSVARFICYPGDPTATQNRTAACRVNTSYSYASGTNPRNATVKVCAEHRYASGNSCIVPEAANEGSCISGSADVKRGNNWGLNWANRMTDLVWGPAEVCCPTDHCPQNIHCYPMGTAFYGGGGFMGNAGEGWACGDAGLGTAFYRCGTSHNGQLLSHDLYCWQNPAGEWRFVPLP